jgi:hypothetical protein
MKFVLSCLVAFFLMTVLSQAAGVAQASTEVYAAVCERLINDESKASARARASDKAAFKAIEEVPQIASYRERFTPHQFNLAIYRLVDNYLDNINLHTVSQDAQNVCVEINAELTSSAINEVFASLMTPQQPAAVTPQDDNVGLDVEVDVPQEELSLAIPPKPEIVINKQIAYDTENMPLTGAKVAQPVQGNALPTTLVFVDKTEFYNGTSTSGFFSTLEQALMAKPNIKVTAGLSNPDYILKTKVLKAKVDNVNTETGRLQIVVALELINTATSEKFTDHQNRFVLFNTSEDAQKTASSLAQKLLQQGIEKLLPKIKTSQDKELSNTMITPN